MILRMVRASETFAQLRYLRRPSSRRSPKAGVSSEPLAEAVTIADFGARRTSRGDRRQGSPSSSLGIGFRGEWSDLANATANNGSGRPWTIAEWEAL